MISHLYPLMPVSKVINAVDTLRKVQFCARLIAQRNLKLIQMNRNFSAFCLLMLLFGASHAAAQTPPPAEPQTVNFGLQAGAIFPSRMFRVRSNEAVFNGLTYSIRADVGVQFGGMATFQLGKRFELQGGLMLLMRNYEVSVSNGSSRPSIKLNTTIYELPLQMAYYQPISDRARLVVATGVNMQSLPSNLRVRDGILDVFARKRAFSVPASLTTAGLDFRNRDKGGWMIGISYCITPFPLYDTGITANFDGQDEFYVLPHIGDYFCVVGRYYLD